MECLMFTSSTGLMALLLVCSVVSSLGNGQSVGPVVKRQMQTGVCTRQVSSMVQVSYDVITYGSRSTRYRCGLWGRRCTRYQLTSSRTTHYRLVPRYSTESYCCPGFSGYPDCTPICEPSCMNGGTCTQPSTCTCTRGWTGDRCEQPICMPSCMNGGTCTQPSTCTCTRGWTGDHCGKPICMPSCMNGGTCTWPSTCTCTRGWTGDHCEQPVCTPNCQNGGRCTGPNICTCSPLWAGSTCETPICMPSCMNGGTCTQPSTCTCARGWTADHCEQPICMPSCMNGGTCTQPSTCSCTGGWTGDHCERPICTSNCQNGGQCTGPNVCTCSPLWVGSTCETPFCKPPCESGGTCSSPGICDCHDRYQGYRCEYDVEVTIGFGRSGYMVREDSGTLSIPIRIRGPNLLHRPVTFDVTTRDGLAKAGTDYTTITGSVTFNLTVGEYLVAIPILDDYISEKNETFDIVLSSGDMAILLSFSSATVLISDDDVCSAETVPLLILLGDISPKYLWPETMIGAPIIQQSCPESNYSANVTRYCGVSNSSGAQWSEVDLSQCSVWAAGVLDNMTNLLKPDYISEAAKIVETVLTNAAITDPMVAEKYLNVIDNIQTELANDSIVIESERETAISVRILNSLGRFQDEVVLPSNITEPTIYAREIFALQVQDIDIKSFSGEVLNVNLGTFEEALQLSTSISEEALQTTMEVISNATASISLPSTIFSGYQEEENQTVRLSYSVFLLDALYQSTNQAAKNLSIGTIIVALRLGDTTVNQMQITLNTTFSVDERVKGANSSECVRWEASTKIGEWSTNNCIKVKSSEKTITCSCHGRQPSVHFAVLFDLNPAPPPAGVATALQVITCVGLVISVPSLIITIATYLCSKYLRNSSHGQIIVNISFSLLGIYLDFILAASITTVAWPWLCGLVSALLHYFILVFFMWTAAEAVYLYIKLVKVIGVDKYEKGFTWKAGLLAWIIPFVIVLISMAGYQYYTSYYFCRPTQWPFFFGLILPFTLIYVFNWIMFCIILASIFRHTRRQLTVKAAGETNSTLRTIGHSVIAAMALSLVFGLGWGLGLLATSTRIIGFTTSFQVIFTIFVGTQGLLLLIFHGIRNEKAREVWKQWLYFALCRYKGVNYTGVSSVSSINISKQSTIRRAPSSNMASNLDTNPQAGNAKVTESVVDAEATM